MPGSWLQFGVRHSDPLWIDDREIVLLSRALQIRFPFHSGGIVWNRPVAISVKSSDGWQETLPVRDVTRLAQIALFGTGIALAIFAGLIRRASDTQHSINESAR